MNVHKNAPLTPRSVVEGGLSQADAAYQFNTTPKTVAKWVKRFRAEGAEGMHGMLLDTARWCWASLVPFPTGFANSPKRTCDRHTSCVGHSACLP
jgi:Helix-turn-helix domain